MLEVMKEIFMEHPEYICFIFGFFIAVKLPSMICDVFLGSDMETKDESVEVVVPEKTYKLGAGFED